MADFEDDESFVELLNKMDDGPSPPMVPISDYEFEEESGGGPSNLSDVEIIDAQQDPMAHVAPADLKQQLEETIQAASMSSVKQQVDIPLPWELPGMDLVFGTHKPFGPDMHAIPATMQEPIDADLDEVVTMDVKRRKVGGVLGSAIFERVINFKHSTDDISKDAMLWNRALEKWHSVILEKPSASLAGATMSGLPVIEAMETLREIFGKRSPNTVMVRGNALVKFVKWHRQTLREGDPIPFTTQDIDAYLRSLREANRPASSFNSFLEAVQFAMHVVGIQAVARDGPFSPWAKGMVDLQSMNRTGRKQAVVLTVRQVEMLEQKLRDPTMDLTDRHAIGVMLFALYARCRCSDLRRVYNWVEDIIQINGQDTGFIECCTRSHKSAAKVAEQGISMPLIAPVRGVLSPPWGVEFVKLCGTMGVPLEKRDVGPALPAPDAAGNFTSRACTSTELSQWLRSILGVDFQRGETNMSSHSLKATTLSWLAKLGVDKHTRLMLGHHATHSGSLDSYSRDLLAQPLRVYQDMLARVANNSFNPDSTRSGYLVDPTLAGTGRDASIEEKVVNSEAKKDVPTSSGKASVEPEEPAQDTSSEDSSSSSDETSSTDEEPEETTFKSEHTAATDAEVWKEDCLMFRHKRTKTLHLKTIGSSREQLNCGRMLSDDYIAVAKSVFMDFRKCKQCDAAKTIRDPGAAAYHIGRTLQRRGDNINH